MTRIGVGGLINLDKLRQSHIVLNDIHLFHHHATLQRAMDARLQEEDRSRLVLMVYCLPSVWQLCRRLVWMVYCLPSVWQSCRRLVWMTYCLLSHNYRRLVQMMYCLPSVCQSCRRLAQMMYCTCLHQVSHVGYVDYIYIFFFLNIQSVLGIFLTRGPGSGYV